MARTAGFGNRGAGMGVILGDFARSMGRERARVLAVIRRYCDHHADYGGEDWCKPLAYRLGAGSVGNYTGVNSIIAGLFPASTDAVAARQCHCHSSDQSRGCAANVAGRDTAV